MAEKRKDYTSAMEGYVTCVNQCATQMTQVRAANGGGGGSAGPRSSNNSSSSGRDTAGKEKGQGAAGGQYGSEQSQLRITFLQELRGEVLLRIAVLKKDMGAVDQALQMCHTITGPEENFGNALKANAFCLMVQYELC